MRRLLSGLALAFASFVVGVALVQEQPEQAVVPSKGLHIFTGPGHEPMAYRRELSPSTTKAREEFDTQLQQASEYKEFSPCFDQDGRRTGERMVILIGPPHEPRPLWRIVWTHRSEKFSEIFMMESASEKDARYLEAKELDEVRDGQLRDGQLRDGQELKPCLTRHR